MVIYKENGPSADNAQIWGKRNSVKLLILYLPI